MLSWKSSARLKILGIEGHNAESIRHDVAHGAKFVIYSYNFSLVVVSFKRASNIYFVRAGQSRIVKGLPFTLVALVCGWWGIPHGIIYTIQTLATNFGGGTDVTDRVLSSLAPASDQATTPAPAKTQPIRTSPKPAFYFLAIGILAAIAGIIYSGLCYYKGQNLAVVLISGLPVDYDASLNGQNYHLRPNQPIILSLPEGDLDLQIQSPGDLKGEQHFTFSTDFFSRPFKSRVAVINPDKSAVVYVETTSYSSASPTAGSKEQNHATFYANESTYLLDKPDFVFAEFPGTISVAEGTSSVTKTRLDAVHDLKPVDLASFLGKRVGYAAMHAYLQNQARLSPDDEGVLGGIVTLLQPDDIRALLEGRLSERPVHLEWHRYYQSWMEGAQPAFDLVGRYRRWAEAEPDNGDLAYLYARLVDDRAISGPIYEKALQARRPCAYAAVALGFDRISDTDFQHGLDLLLQAERAGVHSETLKMNKRMALLGLGRTQDVLHMANDELAASPADVELFADVLRLQQNAAPDERAGEQAITKFLARFGRLYGDHAELNSVSRYLQATLAYGAGDEAGFAHLARELPGSENAFETAVSRRDHAAAANALATTTPVPSRCYWILYLTAHAAGDETAAEAYFQKGMAALPKEGRSGPVLARHIQGGTAADQAEILHTPNYAPENSLLFTTLGVRFPEQRKTYFERARLLDVDPQFPHLLLRSILGTAPAANHI